MKLALFTLISILSLLNFSSQQTETGNLIIEIPEIKEQQGTIMILVFNSEDGFPEDENKALYTQKFDEYSDSITHTFENVSFGEYAIVVVQDKNGNGEIDRRRFPPLPKEPVGFSNMEKLGKPNFSKALISFNEDGMMIQVPFLNQ